jgi:hypothetical protein
MPKYSHFAFWFVVIASFGFICLTQFVHETYAQGVSESQSARSRYQISAFSHSGYDRGNALNGAYIIDTVTGKVWQVINDGQPKEIGSVEK